MRGFLPKGCVCLILLFLTAICFPAMTAGNPVTEDSLALPQRNINETASLSETIRRVQRTTGGIILGAERVSYDGKNINRVKYMDENGHVRYVDAPASKRSADSHVEPLSSPRRRDH